MNDITSNFFNNQTCDFWFDNKNKTKNKQQIYDQHCDVRFILSSLGSFFMLVYH